MDNFSIFNKEELSRSIEPFLPGSSPHITPVAYQAWTPDIFLFLFRAINQDDEEHFFVVVSFDHLEKGENSAIEILEQWLGLKVIRLMIANGHSDEDDKSVPVDIRGIYRSYLLQVETPVKLNYWGNNITVTPDSDLDFELADFTPEQRRAVRRFISEKNAKAVKVHRCRGESETMELFYDN